MGLLTAVGKLMIHCSAVIARSSGSMNADRDLCGPRSTDLNNPHPLFCMHDSCFLLLLWDVTYCTYFISYIACCLCLFIVETLCMYHAWYPLHCFYPVNNKLVNFKMFVALLWPNQAPLIKGTNCNSLAVWIASAVPLDRTAKMANK